MTTLTILPSNTTFETTPGITLFEALKAAGAAILAAVGAGTFANVKDACAALVGTTPAAAPGPDTSTYAKWVPHYQALYPALQASFKAVARTAAGA